MTTADPLLRRLHSPLSPPLPSTSIANGLFTNRDLIWQMAKRDVVGRYKGSILGLLWSFLNPLLMLCVYTFAFAYVFRISPHGQATTRTDIVDYALFAFAGISLFGLFSEVVTRAPTCIVQNPNYVKKIVFPLQVFPLIHLTAAAVHFAVSTILLIVAVAIIHGVVHVTILFLPIAVAPLAFSALGVAWILASLGVYVRDIAQATSVVLTMLLYLSPVFYPLSMIENRNATLSLVVRLNPLTVPLENFRAALLDGTLPLFHHPAWFIADTLFSMLFAYLGFRFFLRTKKGFADVV